MYSLKYLFRVFINDHIETAMPANANITVSDIMRLVIRYLHAHWSKPLKFYRKLNS